MGYDSICGLTPEEWQALPYIVYSIQANCIAYFSGQEKFRPLAQANRDMLTWLLEHKGMLSF